MKELVINSKKNGTHIVLYDDQDHLEISKYKWCIARNNSGKFYVVTSIKSVKGKQRQKIFTMHRLLFNFPKFPVDHKNGNGLDNRRKNIRIATISQNPMNIGVHLDKKGPKYKGVSWSKRDKLFIARIVVEGKKIYLGSFKSETDAAKCYNKGAIKYFGEFAYLNEIKL